MEDLVFPPSLYRAFDDHRVRQPLALVPEREEIRQSLFKLHLRINGKPGLEPAIQQAWKSSHAKPERHWDAQWIVSGVEPTRHPISMIWLRYGKGKKALKSMLWDASTVAFKEGAQIQIALGRYHVSPDSPESTVTFSVMYYIDDEAPVEWQHICNKLSLDHHWQTFEACVALLYRQGFTGQIHWEPDRLFDSMYPDVGQFLHATREHIRHRRTITWSIARHFAPESSVLSYEKLLSTTLARVLELQNLYEFLSWRPDNDFRRT